MVGGLIVRNFYKKDGVVFEFEDDQAHLIDNSFIKMTNDEIDRHENPEKYLSDEEKAQFKRERMSTLTPIEFDIKLNNAGLYDAVQELIKDNFEMRIAYPRATFFSRTDPFIDQARIALGLTDEQVDMIWESSLV